MCTSKSDRREDLLIRVHSRSFAVLPSDFDDLAAFDHDLALLLLAILEGGPEWEVEGELFHNRVVVKALI